MVKFFSKMKSFKQIVKDLGRIECDMAAIERNLLEALSKRKIKSQPQTHKMTVSDVTITFGPIAGVTTMEMTQKKTRNRVYLSPRESAVVQFIKKPIILEKRRLFTTHCVVTVIEEKEYVSVYTGVAVQSPKDQYDAGIGRKLALTRALESADIQLDKMDRALIWAHYLENYSRK